MESIDKRCIPFIERELGKYLTPKKDINKETNMEEIFNLEPEDYIQSELKRFGHDDNKPFEELPF